MRIVVNTRQASAGMYGGVVRYTTEILKRLPEAEAIAPPEKMTSGGLGHLWEQAVLPAKLKGAVLWSPANFGPLVVRKQLVSIYDLSPIDHPEWFGSRYQLLFSSLVPRIAGRAARIAVPSSFTAERVCQQFGLAESKLVLAPPGIGPDFVMDEAVLRTNQIVAVAGMDPRKNRNTILRAWERVCGSMPEHELVVLGGIRPADVFAKTKPAPTPARTRFVADCSDPEMIKLFQTSAAVVFVPSYEGFGMPAIEALACGAPLITSRIPTLLEALGHMATSVEPGSVDDLAEALRAVGQEPPLSRKETRAVSATVRSKFRWKTTANLVGEALQTIAGS